MGFEAVDKSVGELGKSPRRCGWCWPVHDYPQGFHGFSTGLWGWRPTGKPSRLEEWRVCILCRRWRDACESERLDEVGEFGHLIEDLAVLPQQSPNLAFGVHDGGVILAAELLTDLGEG